MLENVELHNCVGAEIGPPPLPRTVVAIIETETNALLDAQIAVVIAVRIGNAL